MDQVGAGNVSEKSASLFECRGVYAQPDCTGQVSGNGSPDASARKPEYDPHGSGAVDSFAVGDLPIPLWRDGADALPRNGHRARRRPCLFPALSGFRRKRGNSAERLDNLENEFAATKQSAVLETVQQTERQPVQAETMAQEGTGAAKAKPQTAGSESAKERNELFADPEKEARISKVREGIRQTAAAESRFAGMLTPEEEKLMREIISEYV